MNFVWTERRVPGFWPIPINGHPTNNNCLCGLICSGPSLHRYISEWSSLSSLSMYTARRSAYFCVRIIPYAPCMVYLPLFTYIWVIYGVNVGKYIPYMEHMGIAKCCKLRGFHIQRAPRFGSATQKERLLWQDIKWQWSWESNDPSHLYETQLAWRILFAVPLHFTNQ